MDRRTFLGSLSAIALAPSIKLFDTPFDEKKWAAMLFRDFVFWKDEQGQPLFYRGGVASSDQTIHGWLVTVMPEGLLPHHYIYNIEISNCSGGCMNSIPITTYKRRISSKENFMDYLCVFTNDWVMGYKTYKQYLPPIKEWYNFGRHFQTGAIK